MAYRVNWLTHMLAPVTGRNFDEDLARDFWTDAEDLWDAKQDIPLRWAKLFLAYIASAFAQISAPLALIGLVVIPLKHGDWDWLWYWIAIGVGTFGGIVGALLAATGAYLRVVGKSRLERKRLQQMGAAIPKIFGALVLIGVTAFYVHLLIFGAPR